MNQSVEGNRLPNVFGQDDETGLWQMPPGTWRWRIDGWRSKRLLEAVLPSRYPEGPGVVHPHQHANCIVEPRPDKPVAVMWNWNGNEDRPTLKPSILVQTLWGEDAQLIAWHGYMTNGNLHGL